MKDIKAFFSEIYKFTKHCVNDDVPVFAAQASFFMVFSFIPLAMLLLNMLKYIIPLDVNSLTNTVYTYIPGEIAEFISALVIEVFDKSASNSATLSLSVITTLWLASKGITSLYMGLNRIYRPEKKLGFFRTRITSMIYTVLFILFIVAVIVVFGFGSSVENFIVSKIPLSVPEVLINSKTPIFIILLTLLFASFYKFLPRSEMSFKRQLPGAIGAALSWIVFSWAYSLYIKYISNYSYVYGSLTAVVLLMLWLYICMNIFLIGAEFNRIIYLRKN